MPHVRAGCRSVGWVVPGPQAGCNHARAAAWCTPAGGSTTQPHNSHCSSICCVVESPCWARVWVRMRVQQRVHLVPAAATVAVTCHDRCCASAAPAQYHGSLSLNKPSHNELHAFLYIMMRVWTAAAAALLCGRHPRVGAVVMRPEVWLPIQILGPARGSAGVVGGAGKLCT